MCTPDRDIPQREGDAIPRMNSKSYHARRLVVEVGTTKPAASEFMCETMAKVTRRRAR